MPTAEVNGTTLWWDAAGAGRPSLVLHGGLGMDSNYFRPAFDDALGDRLRLVYLDHRCNGRSGRPELSTLTMPQLADDAAGLLDALGLSSAIVLGHSYGGFIAQELAARHPDRVDGLVLIGTTPGGLGSVDDPADDQGPPAPPELGALLSTWPADDAAFERQLAGLCRWYMADADRAGELNELLHSCRIDRETMMWSMMLVPGWSVVDRLVGLQMPALLVVGDRDVFTSPAQSHRIARHLQGAEVVVVDGAGHFPWVERPEDTFPAIREWLDRTYAPSA